MNAFQSLLLAVLLTAFAPLEEKPDVPALYRACGLVGALNEEVFTTALLKAEGVGPLPDVLAVVDMTQPSTAKRLFVVDLKHRKLLLRTWVAHGQGSGGDRCVRTSNDEGSHCTSKGLLRVGQHVISPKHGDALLLHGLERGLNDRALEREIIIHAAPYVSAAHIRAHGRLGRSWGCPAVAPEVMPRLLGLLPEGSLLYVYAK